MRSLEIVADLAGRSAADAFPLLCRMQDYPKFSEAVLELQVQPETECASISTWKIKFGPGTAAWSQRDLFVSEEKIIQFQRLSGDIEDFTGSWTLNDTEGGCRVRFAAEFDTGLFFLAPIVEPMIEDLLRENITSILEGLFPAGRSTGDLSRR